MPVVVQGVRGGTRVQHGLLGACSRTGSEGGLECSTGCLVPVVVQGVMGGIRVQHGLLGTCSRTGSDGGIRVQHGLLGTCSRTGSDGGDSSAARAAWYL